MQISGSPMTSVVVSAHSSGTTQAESVSRLSATAPSARDKQSDNTGREQPQQKSTLQANEPNSRPQMLNPQRINRIEQHFIDPLSSSTHSSQRALRTFQQIDQLGQTELMNRVDTLA